MSLGKRVFSEKEAAEIVQRAVALQESAGDNARAYVPGVTLDELKRIAEEAGIDPKYIEVALESRVREGHKGPLHLTEEFERVVDGELPPEDFDVVMEHVKSANTQRPVVQVGKSLQGQIWTGWGLAGLNVTSRNGRTRIHVKSNAFLPFMTTLYPCLVGSIIATASMSERGLVAAGLGVAAAVIGAGLVGFKALLNKGHEAARKTTDRLEEAVATETESRRPEATTEAVVERLTLEQST
ncbi:MAG: hypothetical protein K8H99_06690 [Nitrospirae bacterium]|nr:hypothetical protein [Fimbriimonadaceae bacterium]